MPWMAALDRYQAVISWLAWEFRYRLQFLSSGLYQSKASLMTNSAFQKIRSAVMELDGGFVKNLAVLNLKRDQNEKKKIILAVMKEKTRQINAMNDIWKL